MPGSSGVRNRAMRRLPQATSERLVTACARQARAELTFRASRAMLLGPLRHGVIRMECCAIITNVLCPYGDSLCDQWLTWENILQERPLGLVKLSTMQAGCRCVR